MDGDPMMCRMEVDQVDEDKDWDVVVPPLAFRPWYQHDEMRDKEDEKGLEHFQVASQEHEISQMEVDQTDEDDKDWCTVGYEEDKKEMCLERRRLVRQEDENNEELPAEKDIKDVLLQVKLGLESLNLPQLGLERLEHLAREIEAHPDEGKVEQDENKEGNKEVQDSVVQDELLVLVELWPKGKFKGRRDRQYGRFGQWQVEQIGPRAQGSPGRA